MTLENLKQKVSKNRSKIIAVTATVAAVTATVIFIKKSNVAKEIRNTILNNGGVIDLSNPEEVNRMYDVIGEATEASISFVSEKEAIIFLSK